ncbi:hypothetical protein MIR68_011352 [Amoeboaphelidium protococcarum]|nr:hypothetical protein MIR68_011352 [Amoeboaphelidium protococcarum]
MDLFSTKFISDQVQSQLPTGFKLRPLKSDDYHRGFLTALSHLTTVGDLTEAQFLDRFHYLKAHNYEYFTVVIEDTKKNIIAASGTCIVERKFVHQNGLVAHLEDVVVHKEYRSLKFGLYIIEALKYVGKQNSCYKIILDCSEKNVPFYEKCGFKAKEIEMVMYLEDQSNKAKL